MKGDINITKYTAVTEHGYQRLDDPVHHTQKKVLLHCLFKLFHESAKNS